MTRRLFAAVTLAAVGGLLLAAPVPKGGKEDFGPVTDEQLQEAVERMKQIGIALHNYHDTYGFLPNNFGLAGQAGKPAASWRVHLLPYLEEEALYKQYNFDEAWDSESNKKLIDKLPKIYAPIRVKTKEKGLTFYRGFDGPDTAFEADKRLMLGRSFPDGTSNTLGVVEAGEPVIWTKPEDIKFDVKKGLPELGGLFDGDFHVVIMDGSVQKAIGKKVNADQFKLFITRSDGMAVNHEAAFGHK
jgi:hypothetical protein